MLGSTQRLLPKGGSSSSALLNSSLVVKGSLPRSLRPTNDEPSPASRNLRAKKGDASLSRRNCRSHAPAASRNESSALAVSISRSQIQSRSHWSPASLLPLDSIRDT